MKADVSGGPAVGPPDPGPAHSLDELVGCLRALKLWAGDPSYETITRRVNEQWRADGRPAGEQARRGTVVDCFKTGRRRINGDLVLAVVRALHDEKSYLAHWRQALRVSLAETAAAAQVRVLDRLPGDVGTFIGRQVELDRLRRLAAVTGGPDPATRGAAGPGSGLCVLAGMAGVGKTQLAVHAGQLLVDEGRFDTTLFVDLRGFHPDPGQPPAEPAAVLDGFLRLLGMSGHEIPYGLAERAAAFRERLAGRRVLIVLDNAAGVAQVRPLLPRVAGTLTLVTSRRRLADLDAELHLDIDLFTPDEAEQLLIRSLPGVAVGADPSAHRRVALRCGHLPLALSVVAGQMATRAGWTVTDHADRLDERHRHRRLDTGVELALHLSYQHLPEQRQTLLRRMAVHPGADLDEHGAAALLDTDAATAAAHLRHLAAEYLVQQPVAGRYALHDLVRAYAGERGRDEDRPADRHAALTRLLDHYLHSAAAAMDALYPAERHRRPPLPARSPAGPRLEKPRAALRWLDAERATLVAVCVHAARHGWPQHAVWLAGTLYAYLDNGGYPGDGITVHTEAERAARLLGDGVAEATALTNLAVVCWQLGRNPEGVGHLERALPLFRAAGDVRGEARVLGNLGVLLMSVGEWERCCGYHELALDRFVQIGDRVGEANTLTNLGAAHERQGRPAAAIEQNSRALVIFRELRHLGGEATALNNLGDTYVTLGRFADAVDCYEPALALFRDIGERYGETCVLNGLGRALAGQGARDEAIARHAQALALATEIDRPEEQNRARRALAELSSSAGD
ncbi:tetratricopeptide repeat protein [Micromonospora sp. WMMD1082]|uniref:tetratricopeptide repeat protein n=1 Tax=Micromonospora sp. WMMD1082 TaxID=3016104 RepID=UPI0024167DC0|nr:tetratricopeptide repeat protein [Micromonospora sp. WMMD1082]MDG4797150.1 tetratricopeptide repeat protein [Micromonospora sp. WMMD1082]